MKVQYIMIMCVEISTVLIEKYLTLAHKFIVTDLAMLFSSFLLSISLRKYFYADPGDLAV